MNHDEAHYQAHEKAIANLTAESYLLGDLSDAEAEAFEKHYFDCRVCSDTIRAGAAMFAIGREVVVDPIPEPQPIPAPAPVPAPLPFRKIAPRWMALAASAMLAFLAGTQSPLFQTATAALPVMEIAIPVGTIDSVMRGLEDEKIDVRFERDQSIEIVITTTQRFPKYRMVLTDESKKVLKSSDLTPKQALREDGFAVLLRALPAGRYFLALQGVRKDGNPQHIVGKAIVVQ